MHLIFFRHAKAEKSEDSTTNHDRRLTEKGAMQSRLMSQGLQKLIIDDPALISSPYVRASETADIIRSYFHDIPVFLSDDLATGDFKSFFAQLEEHNTIIAIGHEPYLSEWLFELTGIKQSLDKASFVILKSGELSFDYLGYVNTNDIQELLEQKGWYARLLSLVELIQKNPFTIDDQSIHRFRILIRKFETLLHVLHDSDGYIIPQNLESNLKYWMDETNQFREMDVLIEMLSESELEPMRLELIQKRNHLIKEKILSWNSDIAQSLIFDLFSLTLQFERKPLKAAWIRKKYEKSQKKYHKLTKTSDIHRSQELHDLRLTVKRMFYICDLFREQLPKRNDKLMHIYEELKNFSGSYLDFVNFEAKVNEWTKSHPEFMNTAQYWIESIDRKTPSLFSIQKLMYQINKRIGE